MGRPACTDVRTFDGQRTVSSFAVGCIDKRGRLFSCQGLSGVRKETQNRLMENRLQIGRKFLFLGFQRAGLTLTIP